MPGKRICCSQFWLRKVHSLAGFLFLGYFLCIHVRTIEVYQSEVVKVLFLYLPLAFHSVYGLFITYESRPNLFRYFWIRNWMYFGQRLTGVFLVPFILLHLGALKWGASYTAASWYYPLWYAGLLAAILHLANGIFGTAIDWGLTVGPHSQRVFVGVCFAAFFILSAYGLYTLSHF